jgi:hypothetical protein
MRKLILASTLASTAIVAAATLSPATAASLNANIAVGHVTVAPSNIGASNQYFTPNASQGPKLKPAVGGRWVCGPIVNYDGTPHCHWVSH